VFEFGGSLVTLPGSFFGGFASMGETPSRQTYARVKNRFNLRLVHVKLPVFGG